MKNMIILAAAFGILTSCGNDLMKVNHLPGKWDLMESALFEDDSLTAVSSAAEANTIYYFGSCETAHGTACEMYVEEDGEQQYYDYVFDETNQTLLLGTSSVFKVEELSSTELLLVREYDQYKSTYLFRRGE